MNVERSFCTVQERLMKTLLLHLLVVTFGGESVRADNGGGAPSLYAAKRFRLHPNCIVNVQHAFCTQVPLVANFVIGDIRAERTRQSFAVRLEQSRARRSECALRPWLLAIGFRRRPLWRSVDDRIEIHSECLEFAEYLAVLRHLPIVWTIRLNTLHAEQVSPKYLHAKCRRQFDTLATLGIRMALQMADGSHAKLSVRQTRSHWMRVKNRQPRPLCRPRTVGRNEVRRQPPQALRRAGRPQTPMTAKYHARGFDRRNRRPSRRP